MKPNKIIYILSLLFVILGMIFTALLASLTGRIDSESTLAVSTATIGITHGYLHDNVLTSRAGLTSDPRPYYTPEPSMHLGSENMTLHAGITIVVAHMTQTAHP